jgi:hypothetical protein
MFEKDLGISVVETLTGEFIIGTLKFDEPTGNIKILFPIGIKSKSTSKTESTEKFALQLYTLSEFSDGKYMIIQNSNWMTITTPKDSLLSEYNRINSFIIEYRDNYNDIDMDSIAGNDVPDMNSYYGTTEKNVDTTEKPNKNQYNRTRWLDKLD